MAKAKAVYVCNNCGTITSKWAGKCDSCNSWDTIEEQSGSNDHFTSSKGGEEGKILELVSLDGHTTPQPRFSTSLEELDRVTGGGLVRGSAILIGGDPGIGKSTLLLQALA